MLAIEDHDEDRLYPAKGVPRAWVASARPIRIEQAPTRWGRINFDLQDKRSSENGVFRPQPQRRLRAEVPLITERTLKVVTPIHAAGGIYRLTTMLRACCRVFATS